MEKFRYLNRGRGGTQKIDGNVLSFAGPARFIESMKNLAHLAPRLGFRGSL